ncbi:MAG TPA: ABC transporter permease subunit [Candidatus Limnocylindria bacterium]|nr:ABC transporter permease subunit [Candidatus Limnocylindria bacterium]
MSSDLGADRAPRRVLRGLLGTLVILGTIEAAIRLAGSGGSGAIPPPSLVVPTIGRLVTDGAFLVNVAWTLAAWTLGMLLATAIAVPAGIVLASSRWVHLAAVTAIDFLRPIPSVALIPLAILLLGRGLPMRVVLIAFAAIWPILFNTITGVRAVDPVARDTARAFGLGRGRTFLDVTLPTALPSIATGLRIAAGIALILAVSAELIAGGPPGLGTWMIGASQAGVPRELLFAGIAVAGILGIGINLLMVGAERRFIGWDVRMRDVSP